MTVGRVRQGGSLLWWLRRTFLLVMGLCIMGLLTLWYTRVNALDRVYTIATTTRLRDHVIITAPPKEVIKGPKEVLKWTMNQTVVISAGCTPYQLWQQVVAVNSLKAMQEKFGFRTNIMRVIACSNAEETIFGEWLSPYHVAPDYTKFVPKAEYAPLNKPAAIHHWMTHGTGRLLPDTHEIIVVDSDFIFVGPIPNPISQPGRPVGAHFELGDMFFKMEGVKKMCKGKCDHWTRDWQRDNEIGPPYAFRKKDGVVLVKAWYDLTVEMLKTIPFQYYFDMFAYMIGSLVHGLPHKCAWGMFLVNKDEIWDRLNSTSFDNVWAFHYAGNYKLVEPEGYRIWWHKHQYKHPNTVHNIVLSCSESEQMRIWTEGDSGLHSKLDLKPDNFNPAPWLREPYNPPTILLFNADRKTAQLARARWVMWTLYHGINDALFRFRRDYCQ